MPNPKDELPPDLHKALADKGFFDMLIINPLRKPPTIRDLTNAHPTFDTRYQDLWDRGPSLKGAFRDWLNYADDLTALARWEDDGGYVR